MKASERRPLGRTALELTVLGFGATAIGNLYRAISNEEAQATLLAVWAEGIRYFDTAPLYGVSLSETRLGSYFARKPRNDYVISTKVGRVLEPAAVGERMPENIYPSVPLLRPRFDYTRDGIMRSFEESLKRLQLERIDLLYLHDLAPMNHRSPEEHERHYRDFFGSGGYDAMCSLRSSGQVGALGVGVGSWEAALRLIQEGDFEACLLAGRYTLLEQTALQTFLPECLRRGVGVVVGGPYNSGILATGPIAGATYNYRPAPPEIMDRVRRIRDICEAHGVDLSAAALQFPLHHPAVVSVIPGMGSPAELDAAIAALECPIPRGLYADLQSESLIAAAAPIGN